MCALSEEIVPLSISSHSGDERGPMTESSETVAVSLSERETEAPPSSVHGKEQDPLRDQNIGQEGQYGTDRTPIDAMYVGKMRWCSAWTWTKRKDSGHQYPRAW